MKKSNLISLVLLFIAVNLNAQAKYKLNKEKEIYYPEDKILDTIRRMAETKRSCQYIIKKTKGKRHLAFVIYQKPAKSNPYYWVKVSEDNGYSMVTWYNFYVYPKTLVIEYMDTVNDKVIDLRVWRRRKDHVIQ